jgi:hypothetical protein
MALTKGEIVSFLNRMVHQENALDELSSTGFHSLVAYLLSARGYEIQTCSAPELPLSGGYCCHCARSSRF